MKFFADEMLGKLARWLRMAGMDVRYQNNLSDDFLVSTSRKEGRIILTRDTKLIRKLNKSEFLFISHNYLEDQFQEFFEHYPRLVGPIKPLTRCAECNGLLERIQKDSIKNKVWPYVYENQESFTHCPQCERIYWRATHVNKILNRLDRMLKRVT